MLQLLIILDPEVVYTYTHFFMDQFFSSHILTLTHVYAYMHFILNNCISVQVIIRFCIQFEVNLHERVLNCMSHLGNSVENLKCQLVTYIVAANIRCVLLHLQQGTPLSTNFAMFFCHQCPYYILQELNYFPHSVSFHSLG